MGGNLATLSAMRPMCRTRLLGDGLTLSMTRWGAPPDATPPIMLLHGIGGCGVDWEPLARTLAATCPVIALDARGHGDSDWSPEAAYSGDAHFADLATALDALGIDTCILGGYSMGGGVAILAAGAMPERVAGLVVIDAYPAPEMTEGSRKIAEHVASFSSLRSPASRPRSGNRPPFDPAIADAFARDLLAGDPRRLDLWPMWDALQCPTLLVRGEHSDVLPPALAAEMLERQPRARMVVMPGVGHRVPFHCPSELAQLLVEFTSDVTRQADAVTGRTSE
jgi:pimeloyl-ACP methyl ester carboxylesterase